MEADSVPGAEGSGCRGAWGRPHLLVLKTGLGCSPEDCLGAGCSFRKEGLLHCSKQVVWLPLLFFFLLCPFSYPGESLLPLPFQHPGPQASGVRGYRWLGSQSRKARGTRGPESCHVSHKSALQRRGHLPGRMSGSPAPGAAARGGSEPCLNTANTAPRFPRR